MTYEGFSTDGIVFVVGENKYDAYWVMRDGIYLKEMFDTDEAAENDYYSDDASSGNEQRVWW